MISYNYRLRINCYDLDKLNMVNEIMKLDNVNINDIFWSYYLTQYENKPYINFIDIYYDLLMPNLKKLFKVGIELEDITIWMTYRYKRQCNMEFNTIQLKKLADLGVTFCISCYDGFENIDERLNYSGLQDKFYEYLEEKNSTEIRKILEKLDVNEDAILSILENFSLD